MTGITRAKDAAIGGYEVKRREPLVPIEGAFIELEHEQTGTRHIHIECADDNN